MNSVQLLLCYLGATPQSHSWAAGEGARKVLRKCGMLEGVLARVLQGGGSLARSPVTFWISPFLQICTQFSRVWETPTPTGLEESTAVHLQFVRQCAPHLYRWTFLAFKPWRKGKPTLHLPFAWQYTSHLYGSTPPICTAVLLRKKYWGLGSPESSWCMAGRPGRNFNDSLRAPNSRDFAIAMRISAAGRKWLRFPAHASTNFATQRCEFPSLALPAPSKNRALSPEFLVVWSLQTKIAVIAICDFGALSLWSNLADRGGCFSPNRHKREGLESLCPARALSQHRRLEKTNTQCQGGNS